MRTTGTKEKKHEDTDGAHDSTSQPVMKRATVKDVVDAVLYPAKAGM
jgi:hypothetical protein